MLILPGLHGSGPGHWQTIWAEDAGFSRVRQRDWASPDRDEWVETIDRAVAAAPGPVTLVAHSLGCVAVAHWAASATRPAASALLVAPADVERADAPNEIRGFGPVPLAELPFPSVLVSSRNDPYASPGRSRLFARFWGSRLIDAGFAGHINVASGHGAWPHGRLLLRQLLAVHAA